MPYIGHAPTNAGTFYVIDDLTMSSSTTYTLQVGGVSVTPRVDSLLITLDGVIQHTPDAYTISGSTLTFASAPGSGVDFYGIIMGQSASFGQGSIGADELKVTGDGSSNQFLAGDGDGTFTFKDGTLSTTTTAGDIIYRANSSALARLGIGSTGQVLTVASGVPAWSTDTEAYLPSAGGTMSGNIAMGGNDISGGGTITGTFVGGITGNVTGNASGTALTVTQAAQSAITSVGTLTSLTTSGNIGLGATPDTWHSSYDALQGANFSLSTDASAGASKSVTLAYNQYIDSGNAWTYINADEASYYQQYNGAHYFATAGAGSADGDVTNSTKLTIYNSGQCEHVSTSDAIAIFNSTHANGTYLSLQASGTQIGYIGSAKALITGSHATNDLTIRSQSDLYLTSGGTSDEALRIDPSQNSTFGGKVTVPSLEVTTNDMSLDSDGHANFQIDRGSTSYHSGILFYTAGALKWRITQQEGDNILKILGNNDAEALRFTEANTSDAIGADAIFRGNVFIDRGAETSALYIDTDNTAAFVATIALRNSSKSAFNDGIQIGHGGGYTMFKDLQNNELMRITPHSDSAGDSTVAVYDTLTKGSGSFKIDHPLPSKKDTHYLVHSFTESPRADLIYRDKVTLVDGSATINIDTVAGMTEGTFVLLCDNVQCFTSNESNWKAVKGSVIGNILTIECEDSSSTAEIAWMVIGDRKDPKIMKANWTDENGKPIIEPEKENA